MLCSSLSLLFFFLCLFHESQCSKAMQSLRLPAYMCSCLCLRRPQMSPMPYLVLSRRCLSVCLFLHLASRAAERGKRHSGIPALASFRVGTISPPSPVPRRPRPGRCPPHVSAHTPAARARDLLALDDRMHASIPAAPRESPSILTAQCMQTPRP